jgi:hypothetical protein
MKTFQEFQQLAEISKAELAAQYDAMERKHDFKASGPADLEVLHGQEVRDAVPDDLVYGKQHRPGIDFVKDPAHAKHPMDSVATGLGYQYSSSHKVMGKPFHIYTYGPKQHDKIRNLALTTDKQDRPVWSFNHYEGRNTTDLVTKVKGHLKYMRRAGVK